jgi:hypothetical protein
VPGHRVELVTELIRSLPKRLRREFVPAGQFAPRLVEAMDPDASDLSEELARQMRMLNGTVVSPDDFDFEALPSHLRVTFRVVEGGRELGRGKDLAALRDELSSHLRADLTAVARQEERSGLRSWGDLGTIEASITATARWKRRRQDPAGLVVVRGTWPPCGGPGESVGQAIGEGETSSLLVNRDGDDRRTRTPFRHGGRRVH